MQMILHAGKIVATADTLALRAGELAGLHTQSIQDPVAIETADDLEDLSTNLSRKIWQKIMILNGAPLSAQEAVLGTSPVQ